ncbi:MAG: hypothetical protein C0490_17710, partial [Marivirga sp.]|nr:hypothetical protein [Marivirga sp.]
MRGVAVILYLVYSFTGSSQSSPEPNASIRLPVQTQSNADSSFEKLVDIGYHRLFVNLFEPHGAKLTVIFEPGAGGTSKDWERVRALLPADIRILTYDRAGSG